MKPTIVTHFLAQGMLYRERYFNVAKCSYIDCETRAIVCLHPGNAISYYCPMHAAYHGYCAGCGKWVDGTEDIYCGSCQKTLDQINKP